jgi:molybdopterin molybdotransferase
MHIEVQLTDQPISEKLSPVGPAEASGAWVEFHGVVRGEENGASIVALEYEAYPEMALREMRRLMEELATQHPCLAARVIHRVGVIPVGEAAIYVGIAGRHRAEAFALLAAFMDRLKQDVPIWKRRALSDGARLSQPQRVDSAQPIKAVGRAAAGTAALRSLDEARAEIGSRCQPLPPVRIPLVEAIGRVLREIVCATEDLPATDKSTRDGYAILRDTTSEVFQVVDTLHAADWKPRGFKPGEAVRVATGASLPCDGLRVVMQEHVERNGDRIRIVRRESATNIRLRGEEVRQGQPLLEAGTQLSGGALAVLATAGCAEPLVSPRLRVLHFTTGDEIVPPGQTPKPGQIRDSNSFLIRGLLARWGCEVEHAHLPEDFAAAQTRIAERQLPIANADVLLISGGASVGDKDFTRPLLEWLGFETIFNQVNLRPGRPLIFGVNGSRVAFGLPGNPLSHFVCFHAFVATALARLTGGPLPQFRRATLAEPLNDAANPRETLWPARLDRCGEMEGLHPLPWASSGDVTCLATANALIRLPAKCERLAAGTMVEFLPAEG